MRLALAALATLSVTLAAPALAGGPPSLAGAAAALVQEVGAPVAERRALLLAVETRASALRAPLESALGAALSARGFVVTPLRGAAEPESAARAGGQDWLLRVRGGLVPGRRDLALVGELIPAWASFFLQRQPDARAIPPRVVQATVPADPEALLLAREARPAGAPFATVRTIAQVPGRVLALAVGEPGEPGRAAIVAVTRTAVLVLSPDGAPVAERAIDASRLRAVRDPAATAVVGELGGGRVAVALAGAPAAEVLALRGDRLELAGTVEAAPLCAGETLRAFGAFEPGTGVLRDLLERSVDPAAAARSPRTLYAVACAPRGGPVAAAALRTDLTLELLDPELRPVAPGPAVRTGTGFALADLDGDGTAELVASSPDPSAAEQLRVLAPLAKAPLLLETPPLPGAILAGAAGDLTGDGVDDAVLAMVSPAGDVTDLLLVTADPREAR